MNDILSQELNKQRLQIDEIVKDLHDLTTQIGHEELANTVSELRNRIKEPFMFVIVGEVKAGKSSFINALLATGKEICKVAPQPMTDTIQQIIYGEKEEIIELNPYLKRIHQPVDILKEIAIVDTPGTNAIVEHHQEITERFIPASDLIVFVFESKNPYRQSAWSFFDFIHSEWHKKIIFVLQQKDLMNEADLQVNIDGVKEYAAKKGIDQPNVFAVSAKDEIEGKIEESGFVAVRDYITSNITGGKAPYLKLQNNITTSRSVNTRIFNGLETRKQQYHADVEFRTDIRETLDNQSIKSNKQVDILVENLIATYDRVTNKTAQELSQGLNFFSLIRRSFSSLFSKKQSAKEWLSGLATNLEKDLNSSLKDKLNEGVLDIADSIQQMAKLIDLKIKNSNTILKNDHEIFSDIAEKRANVLRDLQDTFEHFLKQSENFTEEGLFPEKNAYSPNLATGGGIAVVGVILTTLTNMTVFDITGGILTTVGLLFAGVSVGLQKRKIMNAYEAEIAKGRLQLEEEVSSKLKQYVDNIKLKIDENFGKFDQLLVNEKTQIHHLQNQYESIEDRLDTMEAALGELQL